LKIVSHKDGWKTHAFRFGGEDEEAENPSGVFVTPQITSWYELYGNDLDNETMRSLLNSVDYGWATLPITDRTFLPSLNEFKPETYPEFTEDSVSAFCFLLLKRLTNCKTIVKAHPLPAVGLINILYITIG
jgi:hypothetical protein